MSKKEKNCSNLRELLDLEMEIIKRHIDEHKWFNNIDDYDDGVCDFVHKYAWLMKEVYCGAVCKKRFDCDCSDDYIIESLKD